MNTLKSSLAGCAFLFFASLCAAQEQDNMAVLMQKSGINEQLSQFPAVMMAALEREGDVSSNLVTDTLEQISSAIDRAFETNAMKSAVSARLSKSLDAKDIEIILAWLDSPLGQKITDMENQGSLPAAIDRMQEFAGELGAGGPRVELLNKLSEAINAREAAYAVAQNSAVAMTTAMAATLDGPDTRDFSGIEKQVKDQLESMRPAIDQQVMLSFLYTYRNLSDADLQKYIDFARTEAGTKYHKATMFAISETLADRAIAIRAASATPAPPAQAPAEQAP